MGKTITILGGTGAVGKALVQQAIEDPSITAINLILRRKSGISHPKIREFIGDLTQMETLSEGICGDAALCCIGTTIKDAGSKEAMWVIDYELPLHFASLAHTNGVPQLVHLSAKGANAAAPFFYMKMKGKLEQALLAIGFQQTDFIRPGLLDRPGTQRTGEIIGLKVLYFLNRLGILRSQRPTPVAQVAREMLACIDR